MKQVIDVVVNWFGAVDEENVNRFENKAIPWAIGLEDRSWWKCHGEVSVHWGWLTIGMFFQGSKD